VKGLGVFTALVAVVLALVPGGLLAFAVSPGRTRWVVWSVAPVLSLGLTAIAMSWLPAVGLPRNVGAVLAVELVIAITVVAISITVGRRRGADSAAQWWNAAAGRPGRADAIAVGIPATICAAFGVTFFRSFRQPPGWDAMYHGMLARTILEKGTTVASSVCTTGSTQPAEACHFYPLAADVQWAQVASLSGGRIGAAMLAWEAVIGPVAFVVAVFVLARLLGARTVVAASAASAVIVLGPLWMSTLTGRITQEIAPGLAVSVVVLIVEAIRSRRGVSVGALGGVAVAGVLLTHTYEVLFAIVMILAVIATIGALRVRAALTALVSTSVAAVVAVAPMVPTLFGAGSERANVRASMPGNYSGAFRFWVVDFQRYVLYAYPSPSTGDYPLKQTTIQIGIWLTIPCLLAAVLCFAFRELRWARPWFVAWALFTAVGIWTASSNSGAALFVSGLWYGVQERLRSMILPVYGVLTVAGACAIALCVQRAVAFVGRHRSARRTRFAPAVPGLVCAVVVAALLVLATTRSARGPIARDMAARTPHGPSYTAAARWLAKHTAPGHVVSYAQNLEMLTWSYVDEKVPYLFGLPPVSKVGSHGYDDRWNAWYWLVDNPGAVPAGCLVNRFGVEYVVVGGPRVPNFPMTYQRALVAHSPRVDLVHRFGSIKIYKVNATGTACTTTTHG
jgi:hypothetical protein